MIIMSDNQALVSVVIEIELYLIRGHSTNTWHLSGPPPFLIYALDRGMNYIESVFYSLSFLLNMTFYFQKHHTIFLIM